MTRPIQHAIAEAIALAGGDLCAAGHEWESQGGRPCPYDCGGSQAVYRCRRCGEYDYGAIGGPAWLECCAQHREREAAA